MVLSILLAKAGDLDSSGSQTIPPVAMLIAAFASVNSGAKSLSTQLEWHLFPSINLHLKMHALMFWLQLINTISRNIRF